MKPTLRIKLAIAVLPVLLLKGCGGAAEIHEVWAISVLGALGGAILNTQSLGKVARHATSGALPVSNIRCPSIINTDPELAACRGMTSNGIDANPGQYLRRAMLLCQFEPNITQGWWRTYHLIKFASQANCTSVLGSPDGLTAANITAFNLVGTTVNLDYGLGGNGDQTNVYFPANGDTLFLNSIFSSGWKESKAGGTQVKFQSNTERRITIGGVHAENYAPLFGKVRNPNDVYTDIVTKSKDDFLKKEWDHTVSTQVTGDRLYTKGDAAEDTFATATSIISVETTAGTPIAKAGAIIRTQHNLNLSLGFTTITKDLKYADSTCCWPTEGEIFTDFAPIFNLPNVGGKAFTEEIVVFKSGIECGKPTVTQRGGDAGLPGVTQDVQLYHCQ